MAAGITVEATSSPSSVVRRGVPCDQATSPSGRDSETDWGDVAVVFALRSILHRAEATVVWFILVRLSDNDNCVVSLAIVNQ